MRRLYILSAFVGLLLVSSPAYAMICGGGYSKTESMHGVKEHACYEYFFNNSGAQRNSGEVVVLDISTGTGVNETSDEISASNSVIDSNASDGDVTNIGTYITTSTTADDPRTIGVIDSDSCADQTYCRVQVRGPRLVLCNDATDAVTVSQAVGHSGVATECGGGNGLGVALEAGSGGDGDLLWVYINVGGSE